EVSVNARLPAGSRVERAQDVVLKLEEMVKSFVPETERTTIVSSGGAGGMGPGGGSASLQVKLVPREQRQRTSDQIATDLRRQLVGIPGVVITTRASGGNMQISRLLSGGNSDARLAIEVRGEDLNESARIANDVVTLLKDVDGVANPQLGRQEGRPEL